MSFLKNCHLTSLQSCWHSPTLLSLLLLLLKELNIMLQFTKWGSIRGPGPDHTGKLLPIHKSCIDSSGKFVDVLVLLLKKLIQFKESTAIGEPKQADCTESANVVSTGL